jgi:hypothetical protein
VELSTLIVELVIVALIAYEIWGQAALHARRRRRLLKGTFDLRIRGVGAHPDRGNHYWAAISVRVNHPTEIRSFNNRCVATAEGGNVPPGIIRIILVKQDSLGGLDSFEEAEGGCECYWADCLPRKIFAGKDLSLTVTFLAAQPWSGYLSFQGWDADDQKQYARHFIEVGG